MREDYDEGMNVNNIRLSMLENNPWLFPPSLLVYDDDAHALVRNPMPKELAERAKETFPVTLENVLTWRRDLVRHTRKEHLNAQDGTDGGGGAVHDTNDVETVEARREQDGSNAGGGGTNNDDVDEVDVGKVVFLDALDPRIDVDVPEGLPMSTPHCGRLVYCWRPYTTRCTQVSFVRFV